MFVVELRPLMFVFFAIFYESLAETMMDGKSSRLAHRSQYGMPYRFFATMLLMVSSRVTQTKILFMSGGRLKSSAKSSGLCLVSSIEMEGSEHWRLGRHYRLCF